MNIILNLFFSFFKIGLFGFGGGYAMLSLIQNEVVSSGWMTNHEFIDIIAIAQITPGPVSVNTATFVGYRTGSYLGAVIATIGLIAPSFILVMILAYLIRTRTNSLFTNMLLNNLKPVIVALIAGAAITISGVSVVDIPGFIIAVATFILLWKTKLHPILLVVASGIAGILLYSF
ncbi:MAG TPA: chromate transporter [Thermotogota bacterium]|nr:chromate transporter [Thermotogota bacterium]HPJ90058.1 chromate transporter [Thermotogota bacterium]HPR97339.1 chromate transporter [Thermotogota bacterium]